MEISRKIVEYSHEFVEYLKLKSGLSWNVTRECNFSHVILFTLSIIFMPFLSKNFPKILQFVK